jgi:hypothetical protein
VNRRFFLKTVSKTAAGLVLSGRLCTGMAQELSNLNKEKNDKYRHEMEDLEKYDFIFPRVKFAPVKVPGRGQGRDFWNARPGGERNLLRRLSSVIRCKTKPVLHVKNDGFAPQYANKEGQLNAVVTFDDRETINKYPFLFMTGENEFRFTQNQKDNLQDYIKRGGFLFMEDCVVDQGGDFFFKSAFDLLESVFGKSSVKTIPRQHEIFHNVYDLGDIGLPYMKGQPHGARGVFVNDRLAVFLSSHDIHCGWCDNTCMNFGPVKYEQALRMGINIIMYSITH